MLEKSYEFIEPSLLSAIAVGQPGKRTFFLVIGENQDWIRLWLEKEQLEAVSVVIDQFFVSLSQELPRFSEESGEQPVNDDPVGLPLGEFEIDQIGIGFDKEQENVVLEFFVHTLGPQHFDEIPVSCWINLDKVRSLGRRAREVCAAGRPRCKLCGRPIDPTGHDCPRQN